MSDGPYDGAMHDNGSYGWDQASARPTEAGHIEALESRVAQLEECLVFLMVAANDWGWGFWTRSMTPEEREHLRTTGAEVLARLHQRGLFMNASARER